MSRTIPPIHFSQNLECHGCDLHLNQACGNPDIPTRLLAACPDSTDTALLIVGNRPGVEEVQANAHFVGPSGRLLMHVYVKGAELLRYADVFGTNAARCQPPPRCDPTIVQYRTCCEAYTVPDIEALKTHYKRVVVLGAGAGASQSLRGSTLDEALHHQGERIGDVTYFWTNNPAELLPGRNPSLVSNVANHLNLLVEFLRDGRLSQSLILPEPARSPHDIGKFMGPLALDTETYGAVAGLPVQTVYQPIRAMLTDKCPRDQLVQTVACAWRNPDFELRGATWNLQDLSERADFWRFMWNYWHRGGRRILGMNTAFDVMFMREFTNHHYLWSNQYWELMCLGIVNYLHSEVRQERSLKNISPLLQVTDYTKEKSLKDGHRYASPNDPALHHYNFKDAAATLCDTELLIRWIKRDYPDSAKMSDYCIHWYSRLLWFAVTASEDGVTFQREKLAELRKRMEHQADRIQRFAKAKWGAIFAGPGSDKWAYPFIADLVNKCGLARDKRVSKTPTLKLVSANDENYNLCLGVLDPKSEEARKIKLLQTFTTRRDIVSRYARPLFEGRKNPKGGGWSNACVLLDDRVYPTWHVIPGQFEDSGSGGTKQGRITCRNPGLLNLAKPVKQCLYTRFSPGLLIEADESQIELRTGALWSGDPVMLEDYQLGRDRHTATARIILTELQAFMRERNFTEKFGISLEWLETILAMDNATLKKRKDFYRWRHLGKTVNFLVLFAGGAKKAQETGCRDVGILLPLAVWKRIIGAFDERHPVFRKAQKDWLREVTRTGRAILPLIGQSRLFLGGRAATEEAINEIANFPIQTQAANALIDGADKARQAFRAKGLAARCSLYIYDAMYVECPQEEEEVVCSIVKECLSHINYWQRLEEYYGRKCPLDCEIEILARRP